MVKWQDKKHHVVAFGLLCFMSRYCFFSLLIAILMASCSNKYQSFTHQYSFTSATGIPNYGQLDYWAAHPWKKDPSDSVPQPLRYEWRDSLVDVFFLHPTTYTGSITTQNAAIDDASLNAKTDYTSILYQASVFNQQCRVFAPRYRQAHINSFFIENKEKAAAAFDTAYADLKNAFEYYLQTWNGGRPIIIAGHSQGALMAQRLLKDFFEDTPLKNKLVVAYTIGWPVATTYFSSLKMCEDSLQTGCLCSWRTFRKNYVPSYLKNNTDDVYVTNPINWLTTDAYAGKQQNKGSVLRKFNKVYPAVTDAQIVKGILYVKKPKFPWSFLYFTKNYHVADINLFYLNIRENVAQRIAMFWKR
jgi:hypothetical protein